LGGALACGCTDDDELTPRGTVGPVFLDGSRDAVAPQRDSGPADARQEPVSDATDAKAPPELSASECPELPLPPSADRLEALTALALTETRVYVATATKLHAFNRQGGCAGAKVGDLPHIARALAPGSADSVIASVTGGPDAANGNVVLIEAGGSETTLCPDSAARSLDHVPELDVGYAALVGAEIRKLRLAGPACTAEPVETGTSAADILAAAVDRVTSGVVVAVRRHADERLVLTRLSDGAEATGPCSARALIDTQLGVATLDPVCARVRFIAVDTGFERFTFSIPGGEIGRAIAAVPATGTQELALGTVDASGRVRLRVIDVRAP
jgi:hypothetical protein